jgi:hemolysin activation/secretion protein
MTEKFAHVFSAGLAGDLHENWGSGSVSAFNLTLSGGSLQIQTAAAREFDAGTAQSHGGYGRVSYSASQLQDLYPNFQLFAAINGQWASKNLDASEKMELGGMAAVRAYPEGEAYGDEGYVLTLEARCLLPHAIQPDNSAIQGFAFVDSGSVALNKKPWNAEPNQRHLSGAGVGLTWASVNKFLVKVVYAHRVGDEPARSAPDANDRMWLQATRYF